MTIRMLGLVALAMAASPASASVMAFPLNAITEGFTLTTFAGVADNTEVNGLVVDGITFQYSLGNGHLIINGGPGVTNSVEPPNIVSIGDPAGVLTMVLPSHFTSFAYGFALLAQVPIASATTISLFDGATAVGSLSYNGDVDPTFAGGFAGISSTLLFNRVEVTFAAAPAFALDNVMMAIRAPEPGTLAMLSLGVFALGMTRRRKAS